MKRAKADALRADLVTIRDKLSNARDRAKSHAAGLPVLLQSTAEHAYLDARVTGTITDLDSIIEIYYGGTK